MLSENLFVKYQHNVRFIMRGSIKIQDILSFNKIPLGQDGIYSTPALSFTDVQEEERKLRESVASKHYDNYLEAISKSHSIPVMDYEVKRFINKLPANARILDIGGCWGWHWRNISELRPDIEVLIVDFVRTNLYHAQTILGSMVGKQIYLLHADAIALPFDTDKPDAPRFDGVWTVQVFQHIPDFRNACNEAFRVLKLGGQFASYSLHITPFNRLIYSILNKCYFIKGVINNQYYLERANNQQRQIVMDVFGNVKDRYTEMLFHPDLKFCISGRQNNWIGKLDAFLGDFSRLSNLFARQRSFEATKLI
jgi:ubiquinone/menaquinone biosynthesis C-methylase UbiE